MKQRYERQRQNAVERVYTKHLVGPMVCRGKADEIGILHIPESSLDMMLATIAEYDLLVGKVPMVVST